MTVSAATRFQNFNGSGSAGPFTVNFRILIRDNGSPQVKLTRISSAGVETVLSYPGQYSFAAIAGGINGGQFTLATVLAVGERLTVEGLTDVDQAVDYANQGDFAPETHELSYDKLTMIVQEQSRTQGTAIRIPSTDVTGTSTVTPSASVRAGKFLTFDASGNVTVSSFAVNVTGQLPWFTPTTLAPTLSDVTRGLYYPATGQIGLCVNSGDVMRLTGVATPGSYLDLQNTIGSAYGTNEHAKLTFEAKGTAKSIRMDFIAKRVTSDNLNASGIAFWGGAGRLIMRLEPTGVNYTGNLDRHVHLEPGYSGTGQFPSIRSMANDGTVDGNNNVTTEDINFGILSCGRGYIGLHTRGGNTDTAVGGGAGTGGGTDVLQMMVTDTPAATVHLQATGGTASSPARFGVTSFFVTDPGLRFFTQNAGGFTFATDGASYQDPSSTDLVQFAIGHISNAVNYWRFQGASTGINVYSQPDGSDTNIGVIWGTKGTGSWFFQSASGTLGQFVILHQASSVNYLYVQGAATGNAPTLGCYPVGDTNQNINLAPRGTGTVSAPHFSPSSSTAPANGLYLRGSNNPAISANSNVAFSVTLGASGGNHIRANAAGAGGVSYIGTDGADSTGIFALVNIGSADILFYTGFSVLQGRFVHAASAVNTWYMKAGATGNAIEIGAYPTGDANIDIKLLPRGTGVLWFGSWTSNADAAINGYVTIKDAAGNTRKLATIA